MTLEREGAVAPREPKRDAWVRPALVVLLVATGALYLWGLGASGWANSYYSAAVQAATKSWKAMFFGSFDASNFITVDKTPGSLWIMDIAARLFGFNAWTVLVPQALEGVAAVGVLYATVKRVFTRAAGLIAGAVLALTPVAALMFRFNNPDALLTLLLVGAAYAFVRALDGASTKWIVAMGALLGFAFLAKMLQAFLVVPGFGLVYLVAAPTSLGRRVKQLVASGAAMIVAGGWWIAIVALMPASARPYIGGSQTNNIFNLMFGYNGFGRLTGSETGSVGGQGGPGGATGVGRWGATGLTRLFNAEIGGQISWLIPAALILLVAMLWFSRGAKRTDLRRASVLLWGSWLVITALTFSLARGIFHPYYTVALAPAIGAVIGIGATTLWRHRDNRVIRTTLAATLLATVAWSCKLLARSGSWHPGVRATVLVFGLLACGAIVVPSLLKQWAPAIAGLSLVVALAGPSAYAIETVAAPHSGAIPSAGPAVAGAQFGPGRFGGPGPQALQGPGPQGGPPQGGGFLETAAPSASLKAALTKDASSYTWVVATVGATSGAGIQISTGLPVLAIGGFNGTDPTPTLAQFEQLVAQHKVHYFIAGRGGPGGGFGGVGPGGSSGTGAEISSWVSQHFTATTVGNATLYDLGTYAS